VKYILEETPLHHRDPNATHAREHNGAGPSSKNRDERLFEFFSEDSPLADAFKSLFENASDAIYILDKRGNFVTVNRKAEELTGFKREDFVGKSFRTIIPIGSLPKAIRGFLDVIRGKEVRLELELKTADKKTVLVEVTSRPLIIRGKTAGTLGIARSITERFLMENRLREANRRLEMLFETAMEGITIVDPNENLTFVNKAFADMLGYKQEELLGLNLRKLVDKEVFETIRKQTEARKKGSISRYELVLRRKDKEPRIVQVSASPLWNDDGSFAGSIGIAMDFTERKKAEEALRESEEKFRKIFESANDGMIYLDRLGRILNVNEKAAQIFGGSKEELLGKHFTRAGVFSLRDIPTLMGAFADILAGKKVSIEICIGNKKGRELYLECSSAITKIDDKFVGILVIARDATERKQMQKKLEEYSQQLEEMVDKRTRQLKETQEQLVKSERLAVIGQVAATVGHDLRNPLTGIASATYYLKTTLASKMDRKAKEMLELIEKDVQYSNKIITDLLEYSREIQLELTETAPKTVIKEALLLVEVPKNVRVLDSTESEPRITMDFEKMKRVFVNLIKNAIDAMPNGGRLTLTSEKSDGNIEFVLDDTGTGMPKAVMEKLWTPFFTTKARGMGLGLAICKQIIDAHGGKISVKSTVGKGSTFTVTIPIEPRSKGGEKV
jgi:two-component system sporulation sensor kinase A